MTVPRVGRAYTCLVQSSGRPVGVGEDAGSQRNPAHVTGAVYLWPSLAFSLLLSRTLGLNDPPGLPALQAHD